MKLHRLPMGAATVALAAMVGAAPAAAQGINLNWNDCSIGAPSSNVYDPCSMNFGPPHKLVISVAPDAIVDQVIGISGVITIRFDAATVPGYWQLQPGGVRDGYLTIDPLIGSVNAPSSCEEAWSQSGSQVGSVSYSLGPTTSHARIDFNVSVPNPVTFDPNVGIEWYVVALNVLRGETTTAGGCATPACFVLEHIVLHRVPGAPGGDVAVCAPNTNQHVTWQGGGLLPCPPFGIPPTNECPDPTPVFEPTWGRLKQMYR